MHLLRDAWRWRELEAVYVCKGTERRVRVIRGSQALLTEPRRALRARKRFSVSTDAGCNGLLFHRPLTKIQQLIAIVIVLQ
jgi:hypothetical protein